MNRTPPADVRRELQREVGFGCPVPVDGVRCGSPYLSWHHFDPPWHVREHHHQLGMIALCSEHHKKADVGAFTDDQLRSLKTAGTAAERVAGRFDWMRQELLGVVGGQFFLETPIMVQIQGHPIVWFTRDESGYLRLSLRMPTTSDEPRLQMDENGWVLLGEPEDFVCPPSGRIVSAKYANGDHLNVEFLNFSDIDEARARYPDADLGGWGLSFPLTAVEVRLRIAGTDIDFGARETRVGGNTFRNCLTARCAVGFSIG